MIFTGFSPNTSAKDVGRLLAFLSLGGLFKLRKGKYQNALLQQVQTMYAPADAVILDSGRSALTLALKNCGVKVGDEVIVQAFTCVVVINAIKSVGATPVFVDVDEETYSTSMKAVDQAITNKTGAIIIQHTFGIPAKSLPTFAKKTSIPIIEDCAHIIGIQGIEPYIPGTIGDYAIFSFGADKSVSSVRGGVLISHTKKISHKPLSYRSYRDLIQHLDHILVFPIGKALYAIFGLGKALLFILRKIGVINSIISKEEKKGSQVYHPKKLENVLSYLALKQLEQVDAVNDHRNTIARMYAQALDQDVMAVPYLRFPIRVESHMRQVIMKQAKTNGILLGDWYSTIVAPADATQHPYVPGTCPIAEKLASEVVNLPTRVTKDDASEVICVLTMKYEN